MKPLHLLFSAAVVLSLAGCSQAQTTPTLAPAATAQLIQQPNVVVLDVRTPTEYADGHLQNARNLNFKDDNFPNQIARLDTTQTYVLYCASGNRSGKAMALMQQQGFRKVVNAGGFKTLKESGLQTE